MRAAAGYPVLTDDDSDDDRVCGLPEVAEDAEGGAGQYYGEGRVARSGDRGPRAGAEEV